jgi:hypothetical protein
VTFDIIFARLWLPYIGKLSSLSLNFHTQKWELTRDQVNDTAVTRIGDYLVDFLGEYEVIFKKALTCVSVAQGKLFDEKKTRGRKSRVGSL